VIRRVTILLVAALLSIEAAPVWALPPPMPAEALAAASDLIALVRVLAVTCVAVVRHRQTGEELPVYRAQLQILEAKKRPAGEADVVTVMWSEIPRSIVGPWAVRYYPGEEVWTHLQRERENGLYRTTWWNARGPQIRAADTTELPTVPGTVLSAPGRTTR
jgi:hypothetical protein